MKNYSVIAVLFAAGMTVAACSALAATGTAVLKGTAEGSTVSGKVRFEQTPEGLHVTADVQGAAPGKHGFHIHEKGSCDDAGNAAGGHFNPDGSPHGLLSKDGSAHAHAGDMGNIEISADGTGHVETTLPNLTLKAEDKYGVSGRAVILHEKEDDFGQPTGNAGARIGCGVIQTNG